MSQVFLEGFLLQASLIFALGAQNIFILETGIRKQHHILVSFVCFLCDYFIIMLGVLGTASLLEEYPQIKIVFGILGISFLIYYGLGKLRSVEQTFNPHETENKSNTLIKSILGAITFSVVNPHAYLDGIILIGGYSTKFSELSERVALGSGAAFYSLIWFLALSSASSTLMTFLGNPRRMRFAMNFAGLILILLSARLGVDVYSWVMDSMNDPALVLQEN